MSIYLGDKKITDSVSADDIVTTNTPQTIIASKTFAGEGLSAMCEFGVRGKYLNDGMMFEVSQTGNKTNIIDKTPENKRRISIDPANNQITSNQGSYDVTYKYNLPKESGTILLDSDVEPFTKSLMQTMYDMIYPVGKAYFGVEAPVVPEGVTATWKLNKDYAGDDICIGVTTNESRLGQLWGGNSAECKETALTISQMPAHAHSGVTDAGGNHAHDRGTMNITGELSPISTDRNAGGTLDYKGALDYYSYDNAGGSHSGGKRVKIAFDASKGWSGVTSYSGNHKHNIASQGGGQGHTHQIWNVQVKKLMVGIWVRTA